MPEILQGERYVYSAHKRRIDVMAAVALLPAELAFRILGSVGAKNVESILLEQERMGEDGQHFTIQKLRTLGPDRLTPLSSLHDMYRRNGIDELAQARNILCGDMSLVGRRPLIPQEFHYQYELVGHDTAGARLVDEHKRTSGKAKPGLLSTYAAYAHIGMPNVLDPAYRLELDIKDFKEASDAHTAQLIELIGTSAITGKLKYGHIRLIQTPPDAE
jgi:lipopolysaccharide/colanic/teichoic acid biosynthesis glycosyltransferase